MDEIKRKPVSVYIDENIWAEATAAARNGIYRKFTIYCEVALKEKLDRDAGKNDVKIVKWSGEE